MRQKSSSRYQSLLKGLLPGLLCLWLSGCATVGWYGQAVRGQVEILCKREHIAQLLADPDTPAELREQLDTALEIRTFAIDSLGLPDSRSYTLYADLEREAAVWNVVAVPAYSMRPRTWCYPIAGCLSYRGYFRRDSARRLAGRLDDRGYDTAVIPAIAYSTLGWFADPVLNTMLAQGELRLAGLIFHELAHEKLFVRGDTAFNEAYATLVEREGVRRWLQWRGEQDRLARSEAEQAMQREFVDLLLAARRRLAELYDSELSRAQMSARKSEVFERLRQSIRQFGEHHATERYAGWLAVELNNAHLASVATYEAGVDAFDDLLEECGGRLACLHEQAERIAALDADQRARFLSRED